MNDIIHELEAVVSERDALRQQLDKLAATANKWASAYAKKDVVLAKWQRRAWEEKSKHLASQAREQQLLAVVWKAKEGLVQWHVPENRYAALEAINEALALPQDTSALAAMVAKAGEVMRKRALVPCDDLSKNDGNSTECRAAAGLCGIAIDAIPAITLDDLKGGAA